MLSLKTEAHKEIVKHLLPEEGSTEVETGCISSKFISRTFWEVSCKFTILKQHVVATET